MRKLVAALACRVGGSRLFGKPMQLLDVSGSVSILEYMIRMLKAEPSIGAIVLGIASGPGNDVFEHVALRMGVDSIRGDERDVLQRLIQCGAHTGATDIFRVTTESPYTFFEGIADAWNTHQRSESDFTAVDGLPEGSHFEMFTLEALERSHALGDHRHRSELCSLYIREHRSDFRVTILPVPKDVERIDIRLTVDYPEDLVLCRKVYEEFKRLAPRIPLAQIIAFLDSRPELKKLVDPFVDPRKLYEN